MEIREAFEASLIELGIEDLDDTQEDIPLPPVDETEEDAPEDEAATSEGSESLDSEENAEEQAKSVDPTVIDINENASLRLPDGTVVPADKAVLMQADYTRKTQELATNRKKFQEQVNQFRQYETQVSQQYNEMRAWYEQRAANPAAWITEIAASAPNATNVIAQALYELAQAGRLDPKFVEAFGIEKGDIPEMAKTSRIEDEVTRLRLNLEQRDQKAAQEESERRRQELVQQRAQVYESEWNQIKASNGLTFKDKAEELDAKRQLLQFAMENKLTKSLIDAHDLMSVRRGRVAGNRAPSPEVSENKRASRAVTPKTSVSGATKRQKKQVSDREAILEAMESLSL